MIRPQRTAHHSAFPNRGLGTNGGSIGKSAVPAVVRCGLSKRISKSTRPTTAHCAHGAGPCRLRLHIIGDRRANRTLDFAVNETWGQTNAEAKTGRATPKSKRYQTRPVQQDKASGKTGSVARGVCGTAAPIGRMDRTGAENRLRPNLQRTPQVEGRRGERIRGWLPHRKPAAHRHFANFPQKRFQGKKYRFTELLVAHRFPDWASQALIQPPPETALFPLRRKAYLHFFHQTPLHFSRKLRTHLRRRSSTRSGFRCSMPRPGSMP
jgi:hypothetical protein